MESLPEMSWTLEAEYQGTGLDTQVFRLVRD